MLELTKDEVGMGAKIHINLSSEALIKLALAKAEGELDASGALVVKTGKRTGRSPLDRFIVKDETTEKQVDWNATNQPFNPEQFDILWKKASSYLTQKADYFESDYSVAAHPTLGIPIKAITELAWHQLFVKNLFIREPNQSTAMPSWTLLSTPGFHPDPTTDGTHSDAAIILNFKARRILICGTYYAGEMKKAMFSVLNFILPEYDVLPMHCAANADAQGDTALFFGLSGTGKTTLSADPARFLIGDDEHGWGQDGIFNFEGGCYAKSIDLSSEREPLIFNAIRYGAVLENVVIDPISKTPNYADTSLTQNTRAAYPREFIPQRVEENRGHEPSNLLFLTCDLYGVLPPVARLTPEQAAYYFLSGYTALVGSTEVGQGGGIKPTFSTCFGAPFFPRPPQVYAELLIKRINQSGAQTYLVNTGWTGGAKDQGGHRFPIPTTRAIVTAIVNGQLKDASYETLSGFNLDIPLTVPKVETQLLNPKRAWGNAQAYENQARILIEKFVENFKRFQVNAAIKQAGPQLQI